MSQDYSKNPKIKLGKKNLLDSSYNKIPKDAVGMCSKCKEWTDVADPCCGAAVWYEGDLVRPEEVEDEGV